MDYLQYKTIGVLTGMTMEGFKPYYKWIIFNTYSDDEVLAEVERF